MNWDDTVATLLVGTERRPDASEADLLRAVATEETRRRAGVPIQRVDHTFVPAPPESRPECSQKASQLLELALLEQFGKGTRVELARVWVQRCDQASRIADRRLVPTLLDLGTQHEDLRDGVASVVGERGRWMASMSERWTWAIGSTDMAVDADAPLPVIAESLRRQRRTDPAAGREMVIAAALGLSAADRAELYGALAVSLTAEDEPLLETLLDERSKKIRAVAASLLSRLPDSALSQRMIVRLEPLIEKKRLGTKFGVELPDSLDGEAARDGIEEKPPSGIGRHAWWLEQIVALTPMQWWEDALGAYPSTLAHKAPTQEVWRGWLTAAIRQHDGRWAAALFDAHPTRELLVVMRRDDVIDRLVAACRGNRPFKKRPSMTDLAGLLVHAPSLWPRPLSDAVMSAIEDSKRQAVGIGVVLAMMGRADSIILDPLSRLIPEFRQSDQRAARAAINQITFRASLDEEFT